jgi:hypothetical protein
MTPFVYDAGALVAADRSESRMISIHKRALQSDEHPIVPASVLAQVWRTPSRGLRDVIESCQVVDLTHRIAREVGGLLAASETADIVDAHVVLCCIEASAICVTSDPRDIDRLADAARTMRPRLTRTRIPMVVL